MLVACITVAVFFFVVRSILRSSAHNKQEERTRLRERAVLGRDPLLAIMGISAGVDLDNMDEECQIAVMLAARLVSMRKSPRAAISTTAAACNVDENVLTDLAYDGLHSAASDLRAAREALL
jgi:hypothetical protein